MGKLRMFETFAGIGMQRRGVENAGYEVESVGISELDKDAIISYAAVHCGLTMDMIENYNEYPSRAAMATDLKVMNINYDFKKGKPYDWDRVARGKSKDLEKIWLACKLTKNMGDICTVETIPDCDLFTFSFPCFVEGTLVLTKDGYKEIQDITENDYVLTHTNSWQKVVKPMINEANKLITINCMASEKIHCTPEHPFYVRKKSRVWNNERRSYDRVFSDPEWVCAKDLTKDYYFGTAINQIEKLPDYDGVEIGTTWGHTEKKNTLSEKFSSKDFWYIIGRYIGDGWIRTGGGIIICANEEETGTILDRLDKLEWNYCIAKENTINKIHISFQEIGKYCEQFGKGAGNKHLTSDIMNLPKDLLREFINGYLDSDGCFTQGRYKLSSVSRTLIYETAQCINKAFNRPCAVYFTKRCATCVIEGRIVNQKDTYQLTFTPDVKTQDKAFYEDGYIWSPINEITEDEYHGLVYNMEVENDNSYQIQNVIVHNCQDLSVAGAQRGIVKGKTRSGLVYEVLRILNNTKEHGTLPKFLLMENVDALINKKNKPQFDALNKEFEELGYSIYYDVMNAKDCSYPEHPTPQNRKRCFGMYIRKDLDNGKFTFPIPFDSGIRLKDILFDDVEEKYYIRNEKAQQLIDKLVESNEVCARRAS